MKVISMVTTKGGAGKSTIATNIAGTLQVNGNRVLYIDTDSQQSGEVFYQNRASNTSIPDAHKFSYMKFTGEGLHKEVGKFKDSFDYIIIDVKGTDNPQLRFGILAADTVLVPFRPSPYDVDATEKTFSIINELKSVYNSFNVCVFLNDVEKDTRISKDILDLIEEYKKFFDYHFLKKQINHRAEYKYMISTGTCSMESKNYMCRKEINELIEEVESLYDYASSKDLLIQNREGKNE